MKFFDKISKYRQNNTQLARRCKIDINHYGRNSNSNNFGLLTDELALLMLRGSEYHEQAFNSFVERADIGFYHYERRTIWKTDAIAAILAGIKGKSFVERIGITMEEANIIVSSYFNTDITKFVIDSPSEYKPILECISELNDDGWHRESIAEWLSSL